MPTSAAVKTSIRSRLGTSISGVSLIYKNQKGNPLPASPAAFGRVEIILDRPEYVGFGGGRGSNLQRTTGTIYIHWLAKKGTDSDDALTWGEAACALFRGQRVDDISYFAAQTGESEGQTSDGNYNYTAVTEINFHFDQLG